MSRLDNFVNTMDSNHVFTTEGHFLVLPYSHLNASLSEHINPKCPRLKINKRKSHKEPPLLSREQFDLVRSLVEKGSLAAPPPVEKLGPSSQKQPFHLKYVILLTVLRWLFRNLMDDG